MRDVLALHAIHVVSRGNKVERYEVPMMRIGCILTKRGAVSRSKTSPNQSSGNNCYDQETFT